MGAPQGTCASGIMVHQRRPSRGCSQDGTRRCTAAAAPPGAPPLGRSRLQHGVLLQPKGLEQQGVHQRRAAREAQGLPGGR